MNDKEIANKVAKLIDRFADNIQELFKICRSHAGTISELTRANEKQALLIGELSTRIDNLEKPQRKVLRRPINRLEDL